MIRILTYNTHFTIGMDKRPDGRRIAEVITETVRGETWRRRSWSGI